MLSSFNPQLFTLTTWYRVPVSTSECRDYGLFVERGSMVFHVPWGEAKPEILNLCPRSPGHGTAEHGAEQSYAGSELSGVFKRLESLQNTTDKQLQRPLSSE